MNFLITIKNDFLSFQKLSKNVEVKKKKLRIFISVLLRNLASLCEILIVVLFSFILTGEMPSDTFLENINLNNFTYFIPLFVLLRVGLNYLDHMNQEILMVGISSSLKRNAAKYLFKKENLSFSYINYKVFAETDNITSIYKIFITILGTLFQLATFSVTLFYLNFQVGLSIVIISLILFFPVKKIILLFKKNTELNTLNTIETHNNLDRILSNYYLIKLLKKEEEELKRFDETIKTSIDLVFKNTKLLFLNHNLFSTLTTLLISVGVIQTFFELNLKLETIFLLIRGAQFISQITSIYSDLLSKKHFIVNYIKDLNPLEFEKLGKFTLLDNMDSKNMVEMKNVSFKYDGSENYIFENLNLSIEKNTHNIFTGPNGSGKSTLIGIIANIYKPNNGEIFISSDDFGYIGPTPLIFKDTLLNNLIYGLSKNIPEELIISHIKEMNIYSDFKKDLLYEEINSKSLSSGQMQKVSFIRALLGKPDILFLDEATSNLDKESVKLIDEKLVEFEGTLINITHKPEQFTGVNNFYEIEANKIKKN
tara:strand:+ start:689 stop:2302 length:1614 start_codon:yes stop_codon:yes gene_type:complete